MSLTILLSGTVVFGILLQKLVAWYIQEEPCEDALLIDVACQTSPLKKLHVENYYKRILTDSGDESSSSEIEPMELVFCSSELNF